MKIWNKIYNKYLTKVTTEAKNISGSSFKDSYTKPLDYLEQDTLLTSKSIKSVQSNQQLTIPNTVPLKSMKKNKEIERSKILKNAIKSVKKYLTATNRTEKNNEFKIIDKYLRKIAEEKSLENKNEDFNDIYQSIRLHFFELIKAESYNDKPSIIFKIIDRHNYNTKQKFKLTPLDKTEDIADITGFESWQKEFENNDYLDYLIQASHFTEHRKKIAILKLKYRKTIKEIAETVGINTIAVENQVVQALFTIRRINNKAQKKGLV